MTVKEASFAYGCIEAAFAATSMAATRISLGNDLDLLFEARERLNKVSNDLQNWLRRQEEKEEKE